LKNKPLERKSVGDAIFKILKFYCNAPTDKLYPYETALYHLNKGKEKDAPYYGFSWNEFKLLIDQKYLGYWDKELEKNIPDHRKSLVPTPKAFELIEARENRIVAITAIKVALYVGLISIGINIMVFLLEVSKNIYFAVIWSLLLVAYMGFLLLKKLKL
jgi:hypothetical protein